LVEWSLDGSLPKLCSVITTSYHVTAVKIWAHFDLY
jgi:hypothetical protein